jgi:molybdate transport system substrate-binding protein
MACASSAAADEVIVAVSSTFYGTLKTLQPDFELATGHSLTIVNGSTPQLASQIESGAPYDVFLAGDDTTVKPLVKSGLAVGRSEFVYAIGMLALYSPSPGLSGDVLMGMVRHSGLAHLAMADPAHDPYGAAAKSTLNALGVDEKPDAGSALLRDSVDEVFTALETQTAEIAFLPFSRVLDPGSGSNGSYWIVPSSMHQPIRKSGVLLDRARDNKGARDFLEYLRSPGVQLSIEAAGYEFPNS